MTEQELSEIEARVNAATGLGDSPCWWTAHEDESGDVYECWVECGLGRVVCSGISAGMDNAQFIAHAREDIPKLLAEVRRLRGLIKDKEYAGECNFCNQACLFCFACKCNERAMVHSSDCEFTPDGELK